MFFFLLGLPRCLQLISYTSFFFLPSSGATLEEVDEAATELMDSGPVDIQVTIAKLDSQDVDQIDVTVDAVGGESISLPELEAPEGVDDVLAQTTGGAFRITITFGPGTTRNPVDLPFTLVVPITSDFAVLEGEKEILTNRTDGSAPDFVFETDDPSDVLFLVAPMDITQNFIGPFVLVAAEGVVSKDAGFFTTALTNSNNLNLTNQLMDAFGNVYNSVGGKLLRRSVNGSQLQTLIDDSNNPVAEKIIAVAALTDDDVVFVTESGRIFGIGPPPASASVAASQVSALKPGGPRFAVGSAQVAITELINFDPDNFRVFMTAAGLVINQFDNQNNLIFCDTNVSDFCFEIVSPAQVVDIKATAIPTADVVFSFEKVGTDYSLEEYDMKNPGRARADRKTRLAGLAFDLITHVDAAKGRSASDAVLVFQVTSRKGFPDENREIILWTPDSGLKRIYNQKDSERLIANPILSDDGQIVIACDITDPLAGQIVFHKVEDAEGAFSNVTTDPKWDNCEERAGTLFFAAGKVLFFRSRADSDLKQPQQAVVNLGKILSK